MKLMQFALRSAAAVAATASIQAAAQAPQADATAPAAASAMRSVPAEPNVPPALRQPLRDATTGPVLLRYQALQKLKQRFDAADLDGSGTLTRDEARQAGLNFIDKNFERIDTSQRGAVSFDDLKAYLIQRREEARSR
jgi:hypothetical protein